MSAADQLGLLMTVFSAVGYVSFIRSFARQSITDTVYPTKRASAVRRVR
jgi:hypothetical protein